MPGAEAKVTLRPPDACDVSEASAVPTDELGTERFERLEQLPPGLKGIRYYTFAGGCVTYEIEYGEEANPSLIFQIDQDLTFQDRQLLIDYVSDRNGGELCGAGVTCAD